MPGLTSGLYIGLSGLSSQQSALNVVGHNIANVNTPGYTRQRADLGTTDSQLFGGLMYGAGATINSVTSVRDRFLDLQLIMGQSQQSGSQARYEGVQAVSSFLGDSGDTGLSALVQQFFKGFQDLSARPEDLSLRQSVVGQAQTLVTALQSRYKQLDDQRVAANNAVGATVSEVNTLTAQIASLNQRIEGEQPPGSDNDARDQRKQLTDKLSTLVGIQVFEGSKGEYQISLDSGKAVLVGGTASYNLQVTPDPIYQNYYRVDSLMPGTTVDVTRGINNGELGARLDLRDNILTGYQRQLDQTAAGLSAQVNLLHRTGFDRSGTVTGLDFFQGGVANAANGLPPAITAASNYQGMVYALSVNAAISGNPSLIATGGVANSPGDNAIARALGNLQNAANTVDTNGDGVGDSGPYSQVLANLVAQVGSQSQGFQVSSDTQQNLVTALQNQRDRVSGVDLDEEATSMMNCQRGYQASARFISVINQLTDQLVNQFLPTA
jgi:flagellar hook-associated protein 1 FlgK